MDVYKLLHERLTMETKWILAVLLDEKEKLAKETLWRMVNERYQEKKQEIEPLIKTRHFLDDYISRLDGAALIDVQVIGRIRMISITQLGAQVLTYKINQN